MDYTLGSVFEKIAQRIDVIYLIDSSSDTYTTLKDNDLFHSVFGSSGSYSRMMSTFVQSTADKLVSKGTPYSLFLKNVTKFTGTLANKARMHIGSKEVTLAISTFPIDDMLNALLITEVKEEEYIQNLHKEQQIDAIKSAYLFSMNVDLITDKCSSMNISEISDSPVNEPEVLYSEWRGIILNMFPPEDRETFNTISDPEYLKKNLQYRRSKSVDCQMMNLEGQYIWVKLIFNRINTGNDDDFRFLFMVEDIHESHTRLMNDLKKYENLANNDSLTGLLNRGRIDSEINSSIERCHSENKPISLIMFDIDHFKHVNDTYGHAVGDYVIKTVSSIASKHIITYDGKLGRWGGEEFIGICENITGDRMAEIAEELRIMISEYSFETVENITSSFGVLEVHADESPSAVFQRIDSALYQAKNTGRNKVVRG